MSLFSRIFKRQADPADPELEAKVAELKAATYSNGHARLVKMHSGHWLVLPFVDDRMWTYAGTAFRRGESPRAKAARHLAFERRIPELKAEQDELQRQADEHNRSLRK